MGDPENGGRFTVKKYRSQKILASPPLLSAFQNLSVSAFTHMLLPLNPDDDRKSSLLPTKGGTKHRLASCWAAISMAFLLALHSAIQQAGSMKATFQIPDDLYREVKAETARDGRTVREVVISLFEQWLRQKKQPAPHATAIDWENFQAPLFHLMPDQVTDHSTEAMRKSITSP